MVAGSSLVGAGPVGSSGTIGHYFDGGCLDAKHGNAFRSVPGRLRAFPASLGVLDADGDKMGVVILPMTNLGGHVA